MEEYIVEENVIHPIVVQDRAMPYRSDTVSNVRGTLEDGLASIPHSHSDPPEARLTRPHTVSRPQHDNEEAVRGQW